MNYEIFYSIIMCTLISGCAFFLLFNSMKKEAQKTILLLKESHKKELDEVRAKKTIDAQQILHDLTAHGESIVRIVPINPTEVFWRSPR